MKNITSQEVLSILRSEKSYLFSQFKVENIYLFGSYALNQKTHKNSDVDLMIDMANSNKNYSRYLELKEYLESKLKKKIDLVFSDTINPIIKKQAENDKIIIQ